MSAWRDIDLLAGRTPNVPAPAEDDRPSCRACGTEDIESPARRGVCALCLVAGANPSSTCAAIALTRIADAQGWRP